jgi:DNA-binding transcriptional LysR family regulator
MTAGRILTRPLFEERFVSILRKGHPAADVPLDLNAFVSLSHLLVSPENDRLGHVDAALTARGLKRRVALTLPQMYAAPMLVARSNMIAHVHSTVHYMKMFSCRSENGTHVVGDAIKTTSLKFQCCFEGVVARICTHLYD